MLIGPFGEVLLALPRPAKKQLALLLDGMLCAGCVWLAFNLRLDGWVIVKGPQWISIAVAVGLALPLFVISGFYRAMVRYAGNAALMALIRACGLFGLSYALIFTVIGVDGVPRSVGLVTPILIFMMVGFSRLMVRHWLGGTAGMAVRVLARRELPQVVIYGAGQAGRQLLGALSHSPQMVIRAFVDDDVMLHGDVLAGLQIYSPQWLTDNAAAHGSTDVLLALPSASRARRAAILTELLPLHLHVRTLPGMADLVNGRVQIQDLQEVDIESLLGRDSVTPVADLLHRHIKGQVVLVTGAGGSIGSELCRQIAALEPASLLLVELSEFALYAIHQELMRAYPEVQVIPLLASVRDATRLREIMGTWHPATVYHAAAYKHVPMVEHNVIEGVRNNAFGTLITAQVALECKVSQFVLVSTDKAVRPTNVMGASKRVAEMMLQGLAQQPSATRFSMVRFGNVLGSSGSVVPLFRRQIASGGPITLTHPDITRYFMTIPEAAQLVIQAGAMAVGGDVFVLDMGEPVKVIDLARRMVELSGRTVREASLPDGDIELKIVGLRPGEKLYEELLIGDNPEPTQHPRVMKAHEACPPWTELRGLIASLEATVVANDVPGLKLALARMLPGYTPELGEVDWVHVARQRQVLSASTTGAVSKSLVAVQV